MKKSHGLTLIELIVTLGALAILVTFGTPLLLGSIATNRAAAQTNTFVAAITYARSEAVGLGVPVAVCAKASPDPSNETCGTGADNWKNGWLVFQDTTVSSPVTHGGDDELLRMFPNPSQTATMNSSIQAIRFRSDGFIDDTTNPWAADTTKSRHAVLFAQDALLASQSQWRCVWITLTGQTRIQRMKKSEIGNCTAT